MASEVDICNLALSHFGQDTKIDAIDPPDGSAEAEQSFSIALSSPNGATLVAAQPFTAGNSITLDGQRVTIAGTPAAGDSFTVAPSSSTLSIFDTLDRAVTQLATKGRSTAQIAQGNTDALRDIDQSMSQLQGARAAAGEMLVRIDSETGRLADQKLANQSERSRAEDLDMTDAISKFQNLQTGYDAALKSYSMVQRLSLFDYLKA